MSLKSNIIANYVGQFYVTLIGIVMLPVYVKYMGVEAFGLVGFYATLQAWFMLLDMGLTPTMAREVARFRGGAIDALSLRRFLRALEGVFIALSVLGAAAVMSGSGFIAQSWLKVQQLPYEEVRQAIMLMAVIVALRWVCGLYRGAINGFERLIWLNGFNVAIATARFVLVIPFFMYVGASPTQFFAFQLAVALIEVTVLVAQTYRFLPRVDADRFISWQWQPLRAVLKISMSITFASLVWILATQTDKLLLSKFLTLSEYANFTLAVMVAGGVLVISGPISAALLPRMTRLNAENNEAGLIQLYRSATQMVSVIAIPTALVLAFFSEQVLWAWTGNAEIARTAAPVLTLYALGNGLLALAAFPYYLQYAKGDLKLHLIGNALFLVILIPMLVLATREYGMVGAGYAWIISNLLPFVVWLPIVHRRFMKGLHAKWLMQDVMPIFIFPAVAAFGLRWFVEWPASQSMVAIGLVTAGLGLLAIAAASSSWARGEITGRLHARSLNKGRQ